MVYKFIGLLVLTIMVVPTAVNAYVSCRDTEKGCTLEQLVQLNSEAAGLGLATTERVAIMQEIIAKLTSLLKQLQMSSSGVMGSGAGACLDLTNSLVIGSADATTNGEVSKLQRFLVAAGMYPELLAEAQITGVYNNATAEAVVKWQKAQGMDFVTVTSGVGPMTKAKMKCASQAGKPTVEKVQWSIRKTFPPGADQSDDSVSEQEIGVEVFLSNKTSQNFILGTQRGCEASTTQSTQNGKTILGKVNCYFSLTGVNYTAYTQNGMFYVERGVESAKDGRVKTDVLVQL